MFAAGECLALDEPLAGVRRGKAGFDADAVGAEEAFREVVEFQIVQGFRTDDGFRDRFDLSAQNEDFEAFGGKTGGVGQSVRHVNGLAFFEEIDQMQRGRAGIDVDEIASRYETGGTTGDGDLFFGAAAVLGRHVFFHGTVIVVDGSGTAINLVQEAALVEYREIAADGRLRCAEGTGQFRNGHGPLFFEDAQDRGISFFRKHGVHTFL